MLAEGIARLGLDRLPWTKALRQWRDRVMFLRRAEGDEWPDLSDAALARRWPTGSPRAPARRAPTSAPTSSAALAGLLPWTLRRRLDAEAPTHFAAPSGSSVPIDYEAEEGPKLAIRVQELFGLDRHPAIAGGRRAAGGRAAVAGASAGAGDARPARLLARQLCGGESRDERPLSAPSLAGRSARRKGRRAPTSPPYPPPRGLACIAEPHPVVRPSPGPRLALPVSTVPTPPRSHVRSRRRERAGEHQESAKDQAPAAARGDSPTRGPSGDEPGSRGGERS